MKKRILLTLIMVITLALVFVISASAATYIYKDAQGNEVYRYVTEVETANYVDNSSNKTADCDVLKSKSGEFARYDENGNSLTWYITATTTDADGSTVYTVACVPTLQTQGYDSYAATVNGEGVLSFVSPVTNFNIVSIDFPNKSNIKTISSAFGGYGKRASARILYCYFPNTITSLPDGVFQEAPVQYIEFDPTAPLEKVPHKLAHGAYLLEYVVNIPSNATQMPSKGTNEGCTFFLTRSLISVTFGENSKLTTVGQNAFLGSAVRYVRLPDSVTTLGSYAFGSCHNLKESPFSETSRCTTMGGRVFDSSNLEEIIVPAGLTDVSIFGQNDYGPFALATIGKVRFGTSQAIPNLPKSLFSRAIIGELEIPEGPTHIPNYFFAYATVSRVKFPNTVETAGHRVFLSANVNKIIFGASFESFVSDTTDHFSFTHQASGIQEIYLPASFYAEVPATTYKISYAFAAEKSSNIKFFYTGSAQELATTITNFKTQTSATDSNNKFLNATQISWAEYSANPESYATGNYIIYDYNVCDAFYESIHEEDNNACVINCDRCKVYGQMEKEPVHIHLTTIEYANGYTALGVITSKCQNEGCVENINAVTSEAQAIFGGVKYAIKKTGIGIVFSYEIYNEAIEVYNEIAQNDLEYGVLAVFKDRLSGEPIVDGVAQSGVASIDLSGRGISMIDFIIKGEEAQWNMAHPTLDGKTTKDRELYMIGYAKDESGITYFEKDTQSTTVANVKAITYTSLLAISAE